MAATQDAELKASERVQQEPHNLAAWLYLIRSVQSQVEKNESLSPGDCAVRIAGFHQVNTVFERAVRAIPGCFKLWALYWNARVDQLCVASSDRASSPLPSVNGKMISVLQSRQVIFPPSHPAVSAASNVFRRAMVAIPQPDTFLAAACFYVECMGDITAALEALSEGLQKLPASQCRRLWSDGVLPLAHAGYGIGALTPPAAATHGTSAAGSPSPSAASSSTRSHIPAPNLAAVLAARPTLQLPCLIAAELSRRATEAFHHVLVARTRASGKQSALFREKQRSNQQKHLSLLRKCVAASVEADDSVTAHHCRVLYTKQCLVLYQLFPEALSHEGFWDSVLDTLAAVGDSNSSLQQGSSSPSSHSHLLASLVPFLDTLCRVAQRFHFHRHAFLIDHSVILPVLLQTGRFAEARNRLEKSLDRAVEDTAGGTGDALNNADAASTFHLRAAMLIHFESQLLENFFTGESPKLGDDSAVCDLARVLFSASVCKKAGVDDHHPHRLRQSRGRHQEVAVLTAR